MVGTFQGGIRPNLSGETFDHARATVRYDFSFFKLGIVYTDTVAAAM